MIAAMSFLSVISSAWCRRSGKPSSRPPFAVPQSPALSYQYVLRFSREGFISKIGASCKNEWKSIYCWEAVLITFAIAAITGDLYLEAGDPSAC